MRSLLLAIAVVALLALGAVALAGALQPGREVSAADRARQLAAELRCPDCQALSVAESRTASAVAIRAEIDELLAEGRTADEVRQHFVDRYGEWILLSPTGALPWILPVAALVLGVGALGWWLAAGRRTAAQRSGREGLAVSDAQRERVREELERLDG